MVTKNGSFLARLSETYLIQAADLRDAGVEFDALWYEGLVKSISDYSHLSDAEAAEAVVQLLDGKQAQTMYSLLNDREEEALRTLNWVEKQWSAGLM